MVKAEEGWGPAPVGCRCLCCGGAGVRRERRGTGGGVRTLYIVEDMAGRRESAGGGG